MSDFLKKFGQFSMGPIIGALISFITVPLIAHFILPAEVGKAGMFTLVHTLMVAFLVVGMDQAYTREYHVEKDKSRLFFHALGIPLLLSLGLLIIFSINSHFFSNLLFESIEYASVIILMGIFGVFITVERFVLLNLRMAERAIEFSVFTILVRALVLLATLLFVLFVRRDFLAIVYAMIIGQMIGNMVLFIRHRKILYFSGIRFDSILLKKLLRFGLPLIVSVGIGSVLTSFDRVALRIWSDFEQLGFYNMAMKIVGILLIFPNSFNMFWIPTAYRWHEEKKGIRDFKIVSDGVLLCMSLAFVGILILRPLIMLILSAEYSEVQFLIGFLCLWPIMLTLSETTTLGIVFSRKSYLNIFVSGIAAIVCISLNFLLVPIHGALGVAIAIGVTWVVFFLARTVFSFRVWDGFSVIKHIVVIVILMFLAFVNTRTEKYVIIINVASIPILLLLNASIVKMVFEKMKSYYQKKNIER